MAINYKKCIRCGSKNVLNIVYGYPSSELGQDARDGKVVLGGCCIEEGSPDYYCKDCTQEWNIIQAIESAYQKIRIIKASIGGYGGPWYEVEIDLVKLKVSWCGKEINAEEMHEESVEHKINKYNRESLLEILKILDLLNWKSEYMDNSVRDGTQWSLEIVREGRTIHKGGSNATPESWNDFCKLIREMTRRRFA